MEPFFCSLLLVAMERRCVQQREATSFEGNVSQVDGITQATLDDSSDDFRLRVFALSEAQRKRK